MPLVVADAIYAGIIAAGEYTAGAVLLASIAAAGTYVLTAVAISYALNKLESALVGHQSNNQQAVPQGFMARGAVQPRVIIYGPTRMSGVVVYEGTSGTKNQYLWFVLAVSGWQTDAHFD